MSTLVTGAVQSDTFKNKAGTREYGRCTAWVNFNGVGTVAIRDSLNVSSITDNGVGRYRVNFAQTMSNADYSAVTDSRENGDPNQNAYNSRIDKDYPLTTSGFGISYGYYTAANAYVDTVTLTAIVFGGDA